MFTVINAAANTSLATFGRTWLHRRRSDAGASSNVNHIGWAIGAVVVVGAVLGALHGVLLPWISHVFSNVSNINTSTTSS